MKYAAMIGMLVLAFLSVVQVSHAETVASESAAVSTTRAAISAPTSELLLPVTPAPIMTYQGTFSI